MAAFRCILVGALGLALSAWPAMAWAAAEPPLGDTAVRSESAQEFAAQVDTLQDVVVACAANASTCDAAAPGDDVRVGDTANGGFEVHWAWLRATLRFCADAKATDRAKLLTEAQDQLAALAHDLGQQGATADDTQKFASARAESDKVLRSPEFENDLEPTWWDRKKTEFWGWISRIFEGVNALGSAAPWLGVTLEWLLFGGTAVGLLFFLLRSLRRQRMRVALGDAAAPVTAWDREATDWARLAETYATEQAWRDAVHCLYWAAIVLLEGRRAWRHNPTRTPREYVRLLKPGSAQQQGLRGLTQIFERVWYGLRAGDSAEFEQAQRYYRQLEVNAAAGASSGLASGSAEVAA